MLRLVRVGGPQVSWEVRYLDKPRWRAVAVKLDSGKKDCIRPSASILAVKGGNI